MSEIDYDAVFGSSADGEAAAPAGGQSAQGDDKQEFTAPADQNNGQADEHDRQDQQEHDEDKEQRAWRLLMEDRADKEQRDWRRLTEEANDRKRKTAEQAKGEKERQLKSEQKQQAKSEKEIEPEQKAEVKQKKPPQSAEENAAYAAARRKAEAAAKEVIAHNEAEAMRKATRMLDQTISALGMRDPYNGKIIQTKAEYDAYMQRYDSDRRRSGGINQSDMNVNQLVNDHPALKAAETAAKVYQQQVKKARTDAARSHFDREIGEISRIDPAVKSHKDLRAMDTYPQLVELFKRGNTLVDAFRLANMDSLTQAAVAAATRSAANKAANKSHLSPTRSRGSGSLTVPADVAKLYRLFNPEATNEEISRHYNKHYKGKA